MTIGRPCMPRVPRVLGLLSRNISRLRLCRYEGARASRVKDSAAVTFDNLWLAQNDERERGGGGRKFQIEKEDTREFEGSFRARIAGYEKPSRLVLVIERNLRARARARYTLAIIEIYLRRHQTSLSSARGIVPRLGRLESVAGFAKDAKSDRGWNRIYRNGECCVFLQGKKGAGGGGTKL